MTTNPAISSRARHGRRAAVVVLVLGATVLAGCSDDGDTESGSGETTETPTVANSPFQGLYNGRATINLSALGQSLNETGDGALRVRQNGSVGGSVVDDRGDLPCTTTANRAVVNSQGQFTYRESGTCDASSEGLGNCDVSIEVSGRIVGSRLSASGPVTLSCGLVTANGSVTFTGNRG